MVISPELERTYKGSYIFMCWSYFGAKAPWRSGLNNHSVRNPCSLHHQGIATTLRPVPVYTAYFHHLHVQHWVTATWPLLSIQMREVFYRKQVNHFTLMMERALYLQIFGNTDHFYIVPPPNKRRNISIKMPSKTAIIKNENC